MVITHTARVAWGHGNYSNGSPLIGLAPRAPGIDCENSMKLGSLPRFGPQSLQPAGHETGPFVAPRYNVCKRRAIMRKRSGRNGGKCEARHGATRRGPARRQGREWAEQGRAGMDTARGGGDAN